MGAVPRGRKVLIVEEESAVRNVLYLLLSNLGCEGSVAYSGQHALTLIGREAFDAVLLDLRYSDFPRGQTVAQMVGKIREICPSLMGRVLVVSAEVTDRETAELLDSFCAPRVHPKNIFEETWSRLQSLLGNRRAALNIPKAQNGPRP